MIDLGEFDYVDGDSISGAAKNKAGAMGISVSPELEERIKFSDDAYAARKKMYNQTFKDMEAPTSVMGKFGRYLAKLKNSDGESIEDISDETLRRSELKQQQNLSNVDKQLHLDDLKQNGRYETPNTPDTLLIGAGRFFDKTKAGTQEIYHENVPNFIENQWDSGKALGKIYADQRDKDEVVSNTIGLERPKMLFAGEQLPLALVDAPALVSRGVIKAGIATMPDGALSFPAISRSRTALGGRSFLDGALKMNPRVASEIAQNAYMPALFPVLDKFTPALDTAKTAISNSPRLQRARSVFSDNSIGGQIGAHAAQDTSMIRPGSNAISRGVDSIGYGIINGSNPLTVGLREGAKGSAIGTTNIDQSAEEGAVAGLLAGAALKATAGALSKPAMTANPYTRESLRLAKGAGYPIVDPIRTGDVNAGKTWKAFANAHPDIAETQIYAPLDSQHNLNMTGLIADDTSSPVSSVSPEWVRDQIGHLSKRKLDLTDSMQPSTLTPEAHADYNDMQNLLFERLGGRNKEPVVGELARIVDKDGNIINAGEHQFQPGATAFETASIEPGTRSMLKDIDNLFENGSITGEQYAKNSKALSDQILATQNPIEKRLLLNANKTLDNLASESPGMNSNEFKRLGVKQAIGYGMLKPGAIDDKGNLVVGKIGKFPMEPRLGHYERAKDAVDPRNITGIGLGKIDSVNNFLGSEGIGWPSLLSEKVFSGMNWQGMDKLMTGIYLRPSGGLPPQLLTPLIKPTTRAHVLNNNRFEDDYEKRLEEYYRSRAK